MRFFAAVAIAAIAAILLLVAVRPPNDDPVPDQVPPRSTRDAYLSEEGRRVLFDIERADLLLGRALEPVSAAIRAGHEAPLRAALGPGFAGRLPPLPGPADWTAEGSFRWTHLSEPAEVDTAGLLAWLGRMRGRFAKLEVVAFGRKKNSATVLKGPDVAARSEGLIRLAGQAKDGGRLEIAGRFVLGHDGLGTYDGTQPLAGWIRGLELHAMTAVHSHRALFEETTAASGINVLELHDTWKAGDGGRVMQPGGVYLGDVDGDGVTDLIVTDEGRRTPLYLGRGNGTFRKSAWRGPKAAERTEVAIFDATGDGRVDVLLGGELLTWNAATEMLEPVPGATRLPNGGACVADYDADGRLDVYLVDVGKRYTGPRSKAFFDDERITGRRNLLFRGLGGGRFEDVTDRMNASGAFGRTFAAVWLHANDDDRPDLFCANEFGRNAFLVSQPDGTFADMPEIDHEFGGFSMGVAAGDIDGDLKTDLYVSNMYSKAGHRIYHHLDLAVYPENVRKMFMASVAGNRYYRARGDLTFEERGGVAGINAVGWGWSGALADFDLDGRLDVYAPCGHTSVDRDKPDG